MWFIDTEQADVWFPGKSLPRSRKYQFPYTVCDLLQA